MQSIAPVYLASIKKEDREFYFMVIDIANSYLCLIALLIWLYLLGNTEPTMSLPQIHLPGT